MSKIEISLEWLEREASLFYGYGWKTKIADHLGIYKNTVNRWFNVQKNIPSWAHSRIADWHSKIKKD